MTNANAINATNGGVCAYVPSPTAAASSVVQLVNASAPQSDTDAMHTLLAVVAAALLDASQVSRLRTLGKSRRLVAQQILTLSASL